MSGVLPCLAVKGLLPLLLHHKQGRTERARKPMGQNKSREFMHQLLSQTKQTQLWGIKFNLKNLITDLGIGN